MRQVQGRVWRNGQPVDGGFKFTDISDCLTDEDTLVWADIYDPDHEALRELATELGLNMWAVEDAVAPKERTKTSVYHTAYVLHGVRRGHPGAGAGRHPRHVTVDQTSHLGLRPAAGPDHRPTAELQR